MQLPGRSAGLRLAFLFAVLTALLMAGRVHAQNQVGNGPHQAHLLFQFDPPPSRPVWFIVCFHEESITSVEALERIRTDYPEFNFTSWNWGNEEIPNLFLTSITWRGSTRASEDLFDEEGLMLGGNYWGVFTIPDEGVESTPPFPDPPPGLPQPSDWGASNFGISQRILRDGYWDGYVYQFVSALDWTYHLRPALPPPEIHQLSFLAQAGPSLQWKTAPGFTYKIQSTDRLDSPFVTRSTPTASGFTGVWTDPDPQPPARRFYRIALVP